MKEPAGIDGSIEDHRFLVLRGEMAPGRFQMVNDLLTGGRALGRFRKGFVRRWTLPGNMITPLTPKALAPKPAPSCGVAASAPTGRARGLVRALALLALAACGGGSSSSGSEGTGGSSATAGSGGRSSATSSGGAAQPGGTGGVTSPGTGGAGTISTASGGTSAPGTGGSGPGATGGATASGGATGSGGVPGGAGGSGGTGTSTGGSSPTGGRTAGGGGVTATGGGNGGNGTAGHAAGTGTGGANGGGGAGNSSHAGVWKVMPLGDSVTGSTCYPQVLSKVLIAGGHSNFQFMGTVTNNCGNGTPSVKTEGHPGYGVTYLPMDSQRPKCTKQPQGCGSYAELQTWAAEKPDIVLMHFATNDCWDGEPTALILSAYQAVLAEFRKQNPGVIFFISKIIPLMPAPQNAVALNAMVTPAWATANTTPTSPVYIIDHWTGFDYTTDTVDGVHPNATGAMKMATASYDALVAAGYF
jgi:hypothetical protein